MKIFKNLQQKQKHGFQWRGPDSGKGVKRSDASEMNTAVLTDLAAEGQFLPVNVFILSSTRVFETACGPLGPVEVF
jgi:hypothetical protein